MTSIDEAATASTGSEEWMPVAGERAMVITGAVVMVLESTLCYPSTVLECVLTEELWSQSRRTLKKQDDDTHGLEWHWRERRLLKMTD